MNNKISGKSFYLYQMENSSAKELEYLSEFHKDFIGLNNDNP
jgi:hypothetical protein